MIFFEKPQDITKVFKSFQHPFFSYFWFSIYSLQYFGRGERLEFFFYFGNHMSFFCLYYQVKMVGHKTPGMNNQPLVINKVIKGMNYHLFVNWADKYIN